MDLPALFAACRTEADFYRVQIEAENLLAPNEVAALAGDGVDLPGPARAWLAKTRAMLERAGGPPRIFRRRMLGENAVLYEGPEDAAAPRTLVVGFGGIAMRLNLPAPVFLQALPEGALDVLILRDPSRAAFLRGVPGYAADLPALSARVAADLPAVRYPGGMCCIGTSAGGAASLYFGVLAGGRRAVSVDGSHPSALQLRFAGDADRGAFDAAIAGRDPRGTVLISAYGASQEKDRRRARLLALGLPGARSIAIAVEGAHGLLGPLLAAGALRRFLAEIVLADTPPAAMPDAWSA